MNLPLSLVRYAFIIAAGIITMYTTSAISSYTLYTFSLLALILFIRLRELWVPEHLQWVAIFVELATVTRFCQHYHGLSFVLFISTLLSLFQWPKLQLRFPLLMIDFVLMNYLLFNEPTGLMMLANLLYVTVAYLLYNTQQTDFRKVELQRLYDELKRKHYELDETRKQIVNYAQQVENMAQAEERNRISREIHDDLGHRLIRVKMMVEAIVQILPFHLDKGMGLILQVREQLAESMENMRMTVRKINPEDSSNKFSLERLLDDLSHESSIHISYSVEGIPYPLYPSWEVALYRNAQEAITNAVRHGQASEMSIQLFYETKQIKMKVSNNGTVPTTIPNKGFGISGMEERMRILGGTVQINAEERFSIVTTIPNQQNVKELMT